MSVWVLAPYFLVRLLFHVLLTISNLFQFLVYLFLFVCLSLSLSRCIPTWYQSGHQEYAPRGRTDREAVRVDYKFVLGIYKLLLLKYPVGQPDWDEQLRCTRDFIVTCEEAHVLGDLAVSVDQALTQDGGPLSDAPAGHEVLQCPRHHGHRVQQEGAQHQYLNADQPGCKMIDVRVVDFNV